MMSTDDKVAAERYILQGHARHGSNKTPGQAQALAVAEFAGGNLDETRKGTIPPYREQDIFTSPVLQRHTGVNTSTAVGYAVNGLSNILDWDHSLDETRASLRKLKAPMLDTHHPDLVHPWYQDNYQSWQEWAQEMERQRAILEEDAKVKQKAKARQNWSSIYGRAPSHSTT